MNRRGLLARFDVRPYAVFAVIMLVGLGASRLVGGVMSLLISITAVIIGLVVAVTVQTVRRDAALNAVLAARWEATRRREAEKRRKAVVRRDAA